MRSFVLFVIGAGFLLGALHTYTGMNSPAAQGMSNALAQFADRPDHVRETSSESDRMLVYFLGGLGVLAIIAGIVTLPKLDRSGE